MKVKILKNNLIVTALCMYFMSKMLWDSFFGGTIEVLSLLLIAYAVFKYFSIRISNKDVTVVVLFVIFSGYIFFDCFLKDTVQFTFRAIYEYIFYASMIFAFGYYLRECDIERLMKKVHFIGLIIVVLSWYEYLSKSYLIGSFKNSILYSDMIYTFRAAVFSRSYLSHGIVLGFISLCAYYLYLISNKKMYFISSIFCWISILTTSSRGPLVSTFVALMIAYMINQYRLNKRIEKRAVMWIVIFSIILIGFGFLNSSFTTGNGTIDYFLYRMRQIINWAGDAGNVGRIGIWEKSIEWFKRDMLFGIGPSKTGSWGKASIGVTESGILKRLCELGIFGFTIYYLFIFIVVKDGIRRYKHQNAESRKIEFVLFFSIIILVLINDIILQSTEEIMVSYIYAFGLGGLIRGNIAKKEYCYLQT